MKQYFFIIIIFLVLILGFVLGYMVFKPQPESKIDSLVIYNKLQNQGFLVTQDYVLQQNLNIDNTTGQWWKDIFWGQQIEASGIMKVNLGVDLQKLQPDDVLANEQIIIDLPEIEIKSVELVSDINLENSQGVFKRLLDNDDGYNQALMQLKQSARQAALQPEIIQTTRSATIQEISKLVNLIVDNKEVIINF
jgi:hypothetical protein